MSSILGTAAVKAVPQATGNFHSQLRAPFRPVAQSRQQPRRSVLVRANIMEDGINALSAFINKSPLNEAHTSACAWLHDMPCDLHDALLVPHPNLDEHGVFDSD